MIALADLAVLQAITLWLDARWAFTYLDAFPYLVAAGVAAKVLGDLIYYLVSPARRRWLYLEDYLLNDLLVHTRFIVPLAVAQGWVAAQVPVYLPLTWVWLRRAWVSPVGGVIIWAINRYLVEKAEDERHRPLGAGAASIAAGERIPAGSNTRGGPPGGGGPADGS